MIFDDYYWKKWINPSHERPQRAIYDFLKMAKSHLICLEKGPQVFVKKLSDFTVDSVANSFETNSFFELFLPEKIAEKLHYYLNQHFHFKYLKDPRLSYEEMSLSHGVEK